MCISVLRRRIVELELAHLKTPYQLYYIERVWRSRTDGSRAKEQIQAGIEWIGPKSGAEAKILALAANLVKTLTGRRATLIVSDTSGHLLDDALIALLRDAL